ncbi:MSCRAMM family protein [Enterococcus sp. SMC-9]|uniref:MSCRAMM family protein n=1 Tax=Enterococcus sp. SMC-9 TaxID=2862343 RepID=UPI001E28C64A|nr:SpaA isopeptide-forming pilin-related protein [Enterococcus sp. SMC-9]MCD1024232.1 hypothetical protein [Enterococcus sp. SMC-9]
MKKKGIALAVLLTVIAPFIIQLCTGFAQTAAAITLPLANKEYLIMENEIVKVQAKAQSEDQRIIWQIHYEKTTDEVTPYKLKFNFVNGKAAPASNWQNERQWLQETSFTAKNEGTLFVTTPKTQTQLRLYIQADRQDCLETATLQNALKKNAPTVDTEKCPTVRIVPDVFTGKDAEEKILTMSQKQTNSLNESDPNKQSVINDSKEENKINSVKTNETRPTNQLAKRTTHAAVTAKDLIISPDVLANVTVKSAAKENGDGIWTAGVKTVSKPNGTQQTGEKNDYSYYQDAIKTNNRYAQFSKGSGSSVIAYPIEAVKKQIKKNGTGSILQYTDTKNKKIDEVIELNFSEVGFYLDSNSDLKPVGAKVTISNIQIGAGPDWLKWDNNDSLYPWLEFSNNLFSGVLYSFVQGFDIDFEFFVKGDTAKLVHFEKNDNSVFTFASLNGYGKGNLHPSKDAENIAIHEFAGLRNKEEGQLVADSLLSQNEGGKYYATADTGGKFDDHLGAANFNLAAVSFALTGTKQSFTMGSTQGRAWNTFASSQVKKVQQKAPTKTVQPIKQYKKGDAWNEPTGASSGFEQRYWNDLDSYDVKNILPWDLPKNYRQIQHNAETGALAAGVPPKAARFVEPNSEHYYFINQETINLYTESILMPESYVITDTLPIGVTIKGALQDVLTLYNLDGQILELSEEEIAYNAKNRELTVTISKENTMNIHKKAAENAFKGRDFSLRVKASVVDKLDETSSAVMTNSAKVKFVYAAESDMEEKLTNKVQTRLKEATVNVTLTKITEGNAALDGAEFGLFTDKTVSTAKYMTKATDKTGKLQFENVIPGQYWLKETKTPTGFQTMEPRQVTITTTGEMIATGISNNQVTNKLKPIQIFLEKIDSNAQALSGAVFKLVNQATKQEYPFVATKEAGKYVLENCPTGSYKLIEEQAPAGYEKISDAIGTLKITDTGEITYSLKGATVDKTKDTIKVNLPKVQNHLKKFDLNLVKKDAATKKTLTGVVFTLFDETGTQEISTKSTDAHGKLTFTGLLTAGKTYRLREVAPLAGYLPLNYDFLIKVANNGKISVTYNDKDWDYTSDNSATGDTNNFIALIIKNQARGSLPNTGGNGHHPFQLLGLGAIFVAGILGCCYQLKIRQKDAS